MFSVLPLGTLPGLQAFKLISEYDRPHSVRDYNCHPSISFPVFSAYQYSDGKRNHALSSNKILFENEDLDIELIKLPSFQRDITLTIHFYDTDLDAIGQFLTKNLSSDAVTRRPDIDLVIYKLFNIKDDALLREQSLIDIVNMTSYTEEFSTQVKVNPYALKMTEMAKEFILQSFEKKIQIQDVAKAVFSSPFHFCRIFKKVTGVSPYQYILSIRMAEAKKMLEAGASVTQTAFSVGFQSLEHFSHAFARFQKQLPSKLRKRNESTLAA